MINVILIFTECINTQQSTNKKEREKLYLWSFQKNHQQSTNKKEWEKLYLWSSWKTLLIAVILSKIKTLNIKWLNI